MSILSLNIIDAVEGILCDGADNIVWETSWAVSLDIILIVIVSPSTLPHKKNEQAVIRIWGEIG